MNSERETTEDPRATKLAELRKQIEEQNRRREAIEAQRAQSRALEDAERELADATRQAEEEQVLADTEAKLGREGKAFARVDATGGMILLRKPHHLRWRRFVDGGKTDTESVQKVALEHLVYPSESRFTAMVEEHVDTLRLCGNALARLHGTRAKEVLPGK